MSFRLDIQGMRALAVSSVFIFHLNHAYLPGGFLGVDVFFVISGFLISGIVMNKIEKKEFSFIGFYQSRFKRILPAYYFLLAIVSIAVIFIYFNQDIKFYRKGLLWSALFNSNNYFSTLDTYFGAQNSENPLLHTWTLAVEMQFYFILPIILWLFRKKKLIWTISILTIASLIYCQTQILYGKQAVAMYYSLSARSSEFFIGVLAQIYTQKKVTIPKFLNNAIAVTGLLMIIVPMFFYSEKTIFPGLTAMIPCIGTGLLLTNHKNIVNQFLENKIFVFIGQLSYSIYLWHWPFMALYRYYFSQYEIPFSHAVTLSISIITCSFLSYYLIEEVWRKKSNKIFLFGASSALATLAALVLSVVFINEKIGSTSPYFSSPSAMGLSSHGRDFEPHLLGDKNSKDTLMMIGDSHGLVMKPFLDYIGTRNNFAVTTISNDSYPPIPGIDEEEFKEKSKYNLYKKLSGEVQREINKRKTIIIIKAWGIKMPYFNHALIELIEKYPHKNFLILSDYPTLDKNPIRLNRGPFINRSRSIEFKTNYAKLPDEVTTILKHKPNVTFLDLSHLEIFKNVPYYNDTVMYYDEKHLNKFGSEKYAKYAEPKFMEMLKRIKLNQNNTAIY